MKIIKIGRSHSNNCVFSNDSVSGTHAILELESGGQRGKIRDLNSKNGTFVNNKKVIGEIPVTVNDSIRFGSEITSIKGILGKMNETKVSVKLPGVENRTIGKSHNSQIRFPQDDVSREHAVIYKTETGQIVIEDRDSTNGTYVNGVKITSQVLHIGDKVTITRNYPLAWETIFGVTPPPTPPTPITTIISSIAAILIVLLLGGGGYWWWTHRTWDKERIYKEYHDAVCWVYVQYGYKVSVDGKDFTTTLCQLCKVTPAELVHMEGDDLKPGSVGAQGTAFFISKDGKLATNLHITRPWLFSNDANELESGVNKILSILAATQNPLLSRSQVKVEGVIEGMVVIPDGLPVSDGNAIRVTEIKGYDDIKKDVAVIQTETRELPSRVKNVIDINDADLSDDCLTEGRTVFTIGFPYGAEIAMNSNQELKNQVHGGSVTQNRGDYEFGHDAETAGGASGSPIINDKGKLIGIHHAGMTGVTGAQGFNWAIKAKYISDLLK